MQRLEQTTLGSIRCRRSVGGFGITATDYVGGKHLPKHEHAAAYLCLVARGGYVQFANGSTSECTQGLLLVHPQGHCHANHFAVDGARCLNVHFDHSLADDTAISRLLADHRRLRMIDAIRLQRRIQSELLATDAAAELALQAAVFELVAQACRQAEAGRRHQPEWLDRVHERLHDDPYAVPSLQELAILAGVHPAHLARCFQRAHGMSVGEYLRRLRVEHARKALAATRQPIASIAADAGFADQSHFGRVFRHVTGETPRTFRRRMQSRY
ncbi:MAG: helix-turn-helix transcriptional regulator [Rhodanobacteraceae bacterium]